MPVRNAHPMLTLPKQHHAAFARLAARPSLDHVHRAIRESKALLQLADEEGRPLVADQTWERATGFLARSARLAWNRHGVRIDAPAIQPVPDGSIDLHWDEPKYELLINNSADPALPGNFYGDDRTTNWVKGTISSEDKGGYLLWLTTRK